MTIKPNQSNSIEELNMNLLEIFPCAKRDGETKRAFILYIALIYVVCLAIFVSADLVIDHKVRLHGEIFTGPLFFTVFYVILGAKKIRRYTVDYQNNIIADMGSNQEIIASQEIAGVEILDRIGSFEFIKSSKLIGYIGTYKTESHGTIKACAAGRDFFVLIKTKTVPNYVISPKEPEKFVEYMTGRLRSSPDKTRNDTQII